jgi:Rab-like protein 5
MNRITKLKLIVIGPKGSGKSQIANYLLGQTETLITDKYEPTIGVRILEAELNNGNLHIELWDASGDQRWVFNFGSLFGVLHNSVRYEACWKAIMNEADGVILIYNPDAPGQDQQLGHWFDFFVKNNGLSDEQCLIFAHRVNPSNERFRPRKILTIFYFLSTLN